MPQWSSPNAKINITGSDIFTGKQKTNGVLLRGDAVPYVAASWSNFTITDGLKAALGANSSEIVPFGNGVWEEWTQSVEDAGQVFCGYPSVAAGTGRLFKFAGVLLHDQGLQTMSPMHEDPTFGFGILDTSRGTIVKDGYMSYKRLWDTGGTELDLNALTPDMKFFVLDEDGRPVAAVPTGSTNGIPTLADCTYAGDLLSFDKENRAAIIHVIAR